MDAWAITRYSCPRLADDVIVRANGLAILLEHAGWHRVIAVDDEEAAQQILSVLDELRDPAHVRWDAIRSSDIGEPWRILVQSLDDWSMLQEAEVSLSAISIRERERLRRCLRDALEHVNLRVPLDARAGAINEAGLWLSKIANDGFQAIDAWVDPNFYRAVARLSFARLRTSHPLAFEVGCEMLRALAGQTNTMDTYTEMIGVACYAEDQLRSHVSAIADFFVRSLGPKASRLCKPLTADASPVSGVNFAHLVEQALRTHSSMVGQGRFAQALAGLKRANHPLAIGCHVEEYHVTRRFVEMITPLMHCDLDSELRALVFRYFAEEVGHESFELATCSSFGVEKKELERACPLPLHVAFVDVFTMLAALNPIAFFSAVPITEGMIGETSPVNVRLDQILHTKAATHAVYRKHQQLNSDLNHASISRLVLSCVPIIETRTQQIVLNSLALVFELNFRSWEGLVDFYGPQSTFEIAEAFDLALAEKLSAGLSIE